MSNIFSNNVNLDDIFEPRGTFTKRADVGINSGTVDISNRYAPVVHGSPAAATGIFSNNTDISQLFAAIGSVSYWDGTVEDVPGIIAELKESGPPDYSLAELIMYSDGRVAQRNSTTETQLGRWDGVLANSGNSEVRFETLTTSDPSVVVSGSTAGYLSMAGSRAVSISTEDALQEQQATVRVRLRENGNAASEVTADMTLTVRFGPL